MDIVLNGGDEVRQPFRIQFAGGVIADLTGCTVTARIFTSPEIVLSLVIDNPKPTDGGAHGTWVLTEEQTPKILFGRKTRLRYIVVNAAQVTMSTTDTYFNRIG